MSLARYCRQINLLGEVKQLILAKASVLFVGVGGIGSPVLLYWAAGGVNITSIDNPKS